MAPHFRASSMNQTIKDEINEVEWDNMKSQIAPSFMDVVKWKCWITRFHLAFLGCWKITVTWVTRVAECSVDIPKLY